MKMITITFPDKSRMALDPTFVIRLCEVQMDWGEEKQISCVEVTLYNGSSFTLPDRDQSLFDFIMESRGEDYDPKTHVMKK